MLYKTGRRYVGFFTLTAGLVTLVQTAMTGLWLYPSYWWASHVDLSSHEISIYLLFLLAPLPAVLGSIACLRLWRQAPAILTGALVAQWVLKLVDETSGFALVQMLVQDSTEWLLLAAVYGAVTALGALAGLTLLKTRNTQHAIRSALERTTINGDWHQ